MNRTQISTRVLATITPVIALLIGALPAAAQNPPATVNIGVGPIMPSGEVADRFDTGFAIPIGVTVPLSNVVGLRGEYTYGNMGGPSKLVQAQDNSTIRLDSKHNLHAGTANLVVGSLQGTGAYAIGGVGVYHRRITVTTPSTGLITVCDPWWLICYPVAVPTTQVIGSRSTTDLGFNVGAGVVLGNFFAEIRYHYTRGPEFDVPSLPVEPPVPAGKVRANGHYVPVTFGFRF